MPNSVIPYGYSMDITQLGKTYNSSSGYVSWRDEKKTASNSLDFNDMLLLMVTQFQNQTIDNQADTNDMMNQLIQMSVMQGVTEMTTQVKELTTANVMSYAASLVGQWVTLGVYDEYGVVQEKYAKVVATGTYDGYPVIFVEGEKQSYFLSSIMGVGKLPPMDGDSEEEEDEDGSVDGTIETDKDGNIDASKVPEFGASGGPSLETDENGNINDSNVPGFGVTPETANPDSESYDGSNGAET